MEKLKVGVIGTGNMGANHTRIYKTLSALCDLLGVYDADSERCKIIADAFNIKAYECIEELLLDVEAASIAVPTVHHYETAKKALNSGIPILLEKPIAENVNQGRELVDIANQKDLVLQVGHIERFNPVVQVLPEILKDKKIIALDFKRMSPYDPRISDVDVVQDLMIHDIDVLKFLLPKKVLRIEAMGIHSRSAKNKDYAVASMLLEDGVIANLTASRVTEQKIRTIGITADDSFIELDYIDRSITISRAVHADFNYGCKPSYRQESIIEKISVPNHEPLMKEIESFIYCVQNKCKPMIDGADGINALKIVKTIQQKIYDCPMAEVL